MIKVFKELYDWLNKHGQFSGIKILIKCKSEIQREQIIDFLTDEFNEYRIIKDPHARASSGTMFGIPFGVELND